MSKKSLAQKLFLTLKPFDLPDRTIASSSCYEIATLDREIHSFFISFNNSTEKNIKHLDECVGLMITAL